LDSIGSIPRESSHKILEKKLVNAHVARKWKHRLDGRFCRWRSGAGKNSLEPIANALVECTATAIKQSFGGAPLRFCVLIGLPELIEHSTYLRFFEPFHEPRVWPEGLLDKILNELFGGLFIIATVNFYSKKRP
jgi:hypothetical protein